MDTTLTTSNMHGHYADNLQHAWTLPWQPPACMDTTLTASSMQHYPDNLQHAWTQFWQPLACDTALTTSSMYGHPPDSLQHETLPWQPPACMDNTLTTSSMHGYHPHNLQHGHYPDMPGGMIFKFIFLFSVLNHKFGKVKKFEHFNFYFKQCFSNLNKIWEDTPPSSLRPRYKELQVWSIGKLVQIHSSVQIHHRNLFFISPNTSQKLVLHQSKYIIETSSSSVQIHHRN